MKIILSPLPTDAMMRGAPVLTVHGLIITVDGVDYDLSEIPEGGQAEAAEGSPFVGVVTRDQVTVIYHYDSALAEPMQSTDWDDYTFDVTDGEVPCPIVWKPTKPELLK